MVCTTQQHGLLTAQTVGISDLQLGLCGPTVQAAVAKHSLDTPIADPRFMYQMLGSPNMVRISACEDVWV